MAALKAMQEKTLERGVKLFFIVIFKNEFV